MSLGKCLSDMEKGQIKELHELHMSSSEISRRVKRSRDDGRRFKDPQNGNQ